MLKLLIYIFYTFFFFLNFFKLCTQKIGRLEVYGKDAEKCIGALLEHVLDGNVEAVATTDSSLR